jgi:hypothetical protein
MDSPRLDALTDSVLLSAAQRAMLTAVLNQLIPAREALPGAGDLGLAAAVERSLGAVPAWRRLLLDGLAEIMLVTARQADGDFVALAADQQEAVLRAVERAQPLFFAALVDHTYRAYYTLPAVQAALGLADRPPQPLGYPLEPFDPALLAQQRQRVPFWRRTS